MAKVIQYRRLVTLTGLLVIGFLGLGYRLYELQWLRSLELRRQALKQTQRVLPREPRRGDIRDARGNVLATSLFVKTVCADPSIIGPRYVEMARVLAPLLKTNEAYLVQKLQPRVVRIDEKGEPVLDKYVPLKHKVRVEEWEQIQAALKRATFGFDTNKFAKPTLVKADKAEKTTLNELRQHAIFTDQIDDQLRYYPNQTLAAHIIGYLGADGHGQNGVEHIMDTKLRGVRGWLQTERDRRGRELVAFRDHDIEPRPGANVFLTIDIGLQHIVESELAEAITKHSPISVSCVMVRPRTGEILAMATLPNFDPNNPGISPPDHLRNRVICDIAEPGSTFKIVVVAGALNDSLVSLDDRFDCENGHFFYAGKRLKDDHQYGVITVENIVAKSSNIGAAKIGIKMGPTRLYRHIRNFGFGERTGISLLGEVPGIVHPVDKWSKLSITRLPMGQGLATTPLQMAMAMSAIANRGKLVTPMIIDRFEDEQGRIVKYHPRFVRQVIREETAKQMVEALKTVVSTNGTASTARLEHFTVAGKTGTAQKPEHGIYAPGKYFSSFIAFFPADDPALCISVVLDEPKHGYYARSTAAPIFKNIAERAANYLNIRPDTMPTGTLAASETNRPVAPGQTN